MKLLRKYIFHFKAFGEINNILHGGSARSVEVQVAFADSILDDYRKTVGVLEVRLSPMVTETSKRRPPRHASIKLNTDALVRAWMVLDGLLPFRCSSRGLL
ncbi:hypothetical protein PanWU01x14_080280 [Parasponia andersonii]|uniref:Uncharacterized protein n=1 Tax=Parasponia andersonii TaxID=3476 RepID=A0A2P5DBI4_PARAD|nr:hypothetical protein PanWU01x14_080280 [Parasponia andersonii]